MSARLVWTVAGVPMAALCARADVFLTEEQAAAVLFPGETLTDATVTLTDAQRKRIASESGVRVREATVRARRAAGGGWLIFDHVIGKHEFIDFALALNRDGTVQAVEIMAYRETYGHEVRNAKWREQFVGKSADDPLQLDRDIRNISGATLSSYNVTQGVRRLLHTWRIALASS